MGGEPLAGPLSPEINDYLGQELIKPFMLSGPACRAENFLNTGWFIFKLTSIYLESDCRRNLCRMMMGLKESMMNRSGNKDCYVKIKFSLGHSASTGGTGGAGGTTCMQSIAFRDRNSNLL